MLSVRTKYNLFYYSWPVFNFLKSILRRSNPSSTDAPTVPLNRRSISTKKILRLAKKIIHRLKKIQAPTASTFATAGQIYAVCNYTGQMITAFNAEQAKGLPPGSTYYQLAPDPDRLGRLTLVSMISI